MQYGIIFIVSGTDYRSVLENLLFTFVGQTIYVPIRIRDNILHDGKRCFFVSITSTCGVDIWITICIWDDEWGKFK